MARNTTLPGKPVYAGIDYAKSFMFITVGDKKGRVVAQEKVNSKPDDVRSFFARYPKLECALESCRGYEWLLKLLTEMKLTVHLVNTREVKKTRVKTDKIDSKFLMERMAKDDLPTCYQPTEKERRYRETLRARAHLVRTVTRFKQRVHSLLDKECQSVQYPFSAKGRRKLNQDVSLSALRDDILREHLETLDFLEERRLAADHAVRKLGRPNPDAWRLRRIPGFDHLTALTFIAEVGDIRRFTKAQQVAAFIGLAPSVYSSGDVKYTGRITKEGSRLLRWMLVQSAWAALKSSPNLRYRYAAISRRRGHGKAIVAIARKLAEVAYHVLKEKTEYDETKLDAGLARAVPLNLVSEGR